MKIQICTINNVLVARELNMKCASKFKQFEFLTSIHKGEFVLFAMCEDVNSFQFIEMIKIYCHGYIEGRQNTQLDIPNYHFENGKLYHV